MFRTEPQFLIQDELSQPHNYLAVLLTIASGNQSQSNIVSATGIEHVTAYLSRLQELQFVRRDIPATVPDEGRSKSRKGRYGFDDAFMRFYFRFIHPNQHLLEQGLYDWMWQLISEQLRSFIGTYGFKDLCRELILIRARNDKLPFVRERVGSLPMYRSMSLPSTGAYDKFC